MATEYLDFEGTASWARLYEPDNAFGASNWKINLYPKDDAEWEKLRKTGIQKKIKENNNPEKGPIGKYIEFTRPAYKVIKGKMVNFSGPIVMNNEGQVIVDYINKDEEKRVYSFSNEEKANVVRRGQPVVIGNGSDVRIRVAFYDTQKGKGQRLESVTIMNLVEYEAPEKGLPPVVNDVRTPLLPIDNSAGIETENTGTPW